MPQTSYLAAAFFLFASHAVPSWPGVRPALVARLGRPGFIALHSLVSLAALAAFVLAYRAAGGSRLVFVPAPYAAAVAVALMPLAFLLVGLRVATPFGEPAAPRPAAGIYRITRCPGSIGLLVWAGLHLQATGDARRLVLFATTAAIALFAIAKNDWVLRRAVARAPQGPAAAFRAATSILPFAAVLAGRQPPAWREMAWRETGGARVAGALGAYALMLAVHPLLFGVDPLYWLA